MFLFLQTKLIQVVLLKDLIETKKVDKLLFCSKEHADGKIEI